MLNFKSVSGEKETDVCFFTINLREVYSGCKAGRNVELFNLLLHK